MGRQENRGFIAQARAVYELLKSDSEAKRFTGINENTRACERICMHEIFRSLAWAIYGSVDIATASVIINALLFFFPLSSPLFSSYYTVSVT